MTVGNIYKAEIFKVSVSILLYYINLQHGKHSYTYNTTI